MKLYFMKQSALDYITANIRTLYINYFRRNNNQWIYNLFDYDPFELLDALGKDDFSTKVTDIFYSYTFSSNFTIVSGIIKGWREMINKGYKLSTRGYLRPTLQYINALGGVLLDVFDEVEIKKITVDYIIFYMRERI